jgi:hypothetical protein
MREEKDLLFSQIVTVCCFGFIALLCGAAVVVEAVKALF